MPIRASVSVLSLTDLLPTDGLNQVGVELQHFRSAQHLVSGMLEGDLVQPFLDGRLIQRDLPNE
ncbi:hypothetical protein E2C01_083958 [Portunus trituberculatus]|uniref:Uncharacterized protein n=1 Tax=Portunus trituberculatus TaxID=210409 RepID=A0A5B7IU19_PORTR|nr:hypothetical protein [Portunus trituberculatus]